MSKALIVYGTRFGATASTSEEIAKTLREEGFEVKVADAKKEKIDSVSEYDLVVVGSGMKLGKWTDDPEKFLKKFQKELANKKVVIFVSSASQAILEHEGKTEELAKARREYLEDKAAKYSLHPIDMTILGGVWDYNQMGFFFKKTMGPFKQVIEAAGFKETAPDVYDTRDWNAIRSWAKELAQKARS